MVSEATEGTDQAASASVHLRFTGVVLGAALLLWAIADDPLFGGGLGFGAAQACVAFVGLLSVVISMMAPAALPGWLLVLISGSVALVIGELAVHALYAPRFFSAYQFDERLLFELRPGAVREFTHLPENGGGSIFYRVNSQGFRGDEFQEQSGHARVVVYGDSFIHAEFSELESTFPVQLEERLRGEYGGGVEVINAGVAGYGPDQILRRMESELDDLQPDLVILGLFTGNDFGDLVRNRLYQLDAQGALEEVDYRLTPYRRRQIALDSRELAIIRLLHTVRSQLSSEVVPAFDPEAWIREALRRHLAEYHSAVIEGDVTVGEFAVDPYSADIALLPDSESARYKVELMERILEGIAAITDSKGVPILVLLIPHPMDLLDGEHASGVVDRSRFPGYGSTHLRDAARMSSESAGLSYIDLFETFRSGDPTVLYLKGGDDHWSDAGQALAADTVASQLIRDGWLPER
jgi:hypothetical protein